MKMQEQSDTTSTGKLDILSKLFGVVDGNPILNILVVGDSTLSESNNFITPFVKNNLVTAKVISKSNLTAVTLLNTIQSELQNVKYKLVIMMYGHDETALKTPRTTLATLRQSINVARSQGSEVLLILTPFDTKSDTELVELQQTYMQLLYKWMELKSVTVIDNLIKSTGSIGVKSKQLSKDAIRTIAKILVKLLPNFLFKKTDKPVSDSDTHHIIPQPSQTVTTPYIDTPNRYKLSPNYLSYDELVNLAQSVGFNETESKIMAAIAMAESSGNANALNDNPNTGDLSYGLWQINMIGKIGPERRKKYGLQSNEELFNPIINAKAARGVYLSQSYNAWSVYTSGAYKRFLPSTLV